MAGLDSLLQRRPPTSWDQFTSSPLLFITRWAYANTRNSPHSQPINPIRVVCISDTHNTHRAQPPLPAGDVLIHAGDLTQSGTIEELEEALSWISEQPHPHKFFIAGNHDVALTSPDIHGRIPKGLTYLEESSAEIIVGERMLHVYGSPHTPKHGSWPFQYPRVRQSSYSPSSQAAQLWSDIPPTTDILITHGPPFAHRDIDKYGCYALLKAVWRVRPRLHVFGHIHGGRGIEQLDWSPAQRVYEDICAGRAGWSGLSLLLWYKLVSFIWWGFNGGQSSILVNAAAVGGPRDDQRLGAIVVDI